MSQLANKTEELLTRDQFRNAVFERDKNKCALCGSPAKDAHHIIERRLWNDYGYYLSNGASVCEPCHIKCESTVVSVEELREACGILKKVIPDHLYADEVYDKWGNIVLPNGVRLKGELYEDERVQKILDPSIVFSDYVKYPRTYHLPWSPGMHGDDRVMVDTSCFTGKEVVVTLKMDGENTTCYRDYIHARSIDGRTHPSRNWVKNFCSQFMYDIPNGWRVCGENLFAKHSIGYNNLKSYFYGFSIWDGSNCLSWDSTLEWFEIFGITPVEVIYRGVFKESKIRELSKNIDFEKNEGYVVRLAGQFSYGKFRSSVGKYVREKHVQTVKHWMHGQRIEQNWLNGE